MPKSAILELEQQINTSPFLNTFNENMEAVRDKEKAKLVRNLWNLSQYYWPKDKFNDEDDYHSIINDTILRCMKRYQPEKGIFTNYFKNQAKFAIRNWIRENHKKDKREKNYIKTSSNDEFDQGHPKEVFENKKSDYKITQYLDIIEQAFIKKQERVKPWLRTLWTLLCFDGLIETIILDKSYSWIDYDFLEKYRKTRKPTQRKLAFEHGRKEQDLSRSKKQFQKIISPLIKTPKSRF